MPNGSGTGQGGKSMQDRELAAKVRTLTLQRCQEVLEQDKTTLSKDDYELWKAILLKLAGTVLPRLNEHSGPDGKEIPILGGITIDK